MSSRSHNGAHSHERSPGRPGKVAALLLVALLVVSMLPVASRQAEAINIVALYDESVPGAVKPCSDPAYHSCPDGVDRTDEMVLLVQIAAAYWASIFHDSHLYDIKVAWKVGGLPSAQITNIDANGRPTAAIVRVPADMAFWYDPTPFDDEEFEMEPRLYRDTHPAEQVEAFKGSPPEIFEVGYNGKGKGGDLLTILLHELGHAVGMEVNVAMAGRNPACDPRSYPYYDIDPALVGGAVMSLKAYEMFGEFGFTDKGHADDHEHEHDRDSGGPGDIVSDPNRDTRAASHLDQPSLGFDCSHLALGGIKACDDDDLCKAHQSLLWPGMLPNARSRPSIADILAIATAAGWQEVHLPRKYSLASGSWANGDTWLGARVPNAGNNAYIVNREDQVAISLYELGQARDVLISDGNELNVIFGTLKAYKVTMRDPGTTLLADSGALVDVVYLSAGPGSVIDMTNDATMRAFWSVRSDGLLRGGFGSVLEMRDFENRGTIRVNGGVFTIRSLKDGPALDLDGKAEWPYTKVIEAMTGHLVFDGVLTDPVNAAVKVGGGSSVTFTQGWQQGYTGMPETALQLLGTLADATVHGHSTLGGDVIVDGRGRFTAPVAFQSFSRLLIDIDGLEPVAEHDQIVAEQAVTLSGTLKLLVGNQGSGGQFEEFGLVQPGFVPSPNDAWVVMTYGSRVGEFLWIEGWDQGSLRLYPEYGPNQLAIVARLIGDANGDGVLSNADKAALAQSFGPCEPNPVPCVGDINADGAIDQADMHLLQDMLN